MYYIECEYITGERSIESGPYSSMHDAMLSKSILYRTTSENGDWEGVLAFVISDMNRSVIPKNRCWNIIEEEEADFVYNMDE